MPRPSAIGGFQAGVVAIMVTYAVIALTEPVSVKASSVLPEPVLQDEIAAPPSKSAMDELMQQKLAAVQSALEAVTREDYEHLHAVCSEMIALSHKEAWERMASPRFVQDTADFAAAVEFMDRMSAARDPEGISLAFARVSMTCAECHRHIRAPKIAAIDLQRQPASGDQLARTEPGL
jgi:hypothetical protein